jgi:DNA-binding winged helix-turn-helix (wHTH) protein/TolB-like protein
MPQYRFGLFDFDSDGLELRRDGLPVRLQGQPAQVLRLLLENAGKVVTRETLRAAVWNDGTFVDFDRGLNFCVAQIRSALQDSAESPRYVRTVPRRGYQFIAPVGGTGLPARAARPRRPLHMVIAGALVATVLLGLGVYRWRATAPFRIAVTRFDNETGNPELDRFSDGLTDSLVAELTAAGAGRYGVIGNAAILRQPRPQRDLRAIGSSLDARYVVLGQVQRSTSKLRVLAHLIRLPEQTHLSVARIDFPVGDPLETETELAHRIVGEFSPRLTSRRN